MSHWKPELHGACRDCGGRMFYGHIDGKPAIGCQSCGRVVPNVETAPKAPPQRTVRGQRSLPGFRSEGVPVKPSGSTLEEQFLASLLAAGLPEPGREVQVQPGRRWRFDFAYQDRFIAMEVEGGTYSGGRHTRGHGFHADCEKYNAATAQGWRVYRFDGPMVRSGAAARFMAQVLSGAATILMA